MSYDFYITPEEYEEAEKNGVNRKTLSHRVRNSGWDKRRAIETPPRQFIDRKYYAALAESNGIKRSTFQNRVNTFGWDMEKAATTPLISKLEQAKMLNDKRRKAK